MDGINCVKVIDTAANKDDALAACQAINPSAIMVTAKTELQQDNLARFLKDQGVTEDVYLGLTKDADGHWYWDDGDPMFVQR